MSKIHSSAIVGMGALGLLYADLVQTALGSQTVTFLADSKRVEKYKNMTFTVNGKPTTFSITDCSLSSPVDLIIVAVKYTGLTSALESIKPAVGPDTILISVLNGISSEEIIRERYPFNPVIYCIAQGMDAMKFDGALTYSKSGQLCVGLSPAQQSDSVTTAAFEKLTAFFDSANLDYVVEPDILHRLWGKFMLNVGVNQACMAYETTYGGIFVPGKPRETMIRAMKEVIALSKLEGVPLSQADLDFYLNLLDTLSPDGMPSMRQDGVSHRYSEVEMFAGTVRRLAGKHNLPVPVNDWLYKKVKELESAY